MTAGYVSVAVANLHRVADPHSEVVSQAKAGEAVSILEDVGGGWLRVTTVLDGYSGYVPRAQVVAGEWAHTALADPGAQGLAAVRNLRANVYEVPKIQGALVASLPMGVWLACGAPLETGWLPVLLPDGKRGYIQGGDLDLSGREWAWETPPQLRASLVRTAERFLGVPYLWGGTSSFGLDCSGFVQHLFALHGVALPRDANEQARAEATSRIPRDQLLPGDLIFFREYGHVGMAVSHFDFIHATVHLDPVVQKSRVDDPHWAGITDEMRRVAATRNIAPA